MAGFVRMLKELGHRTISDMQDKCIGELVRGLTVEEVPVGGYLWQAGLNAEHACFILEGEVEIQQPITPLPFEATGAAEEASKEQIEVALRLGLALPPTPGSLDAAGGRYATWAGLQSLAWEFQNKAKAMKSHMVNRHEELEDAGRVEMELQGVLIEAIDRALEGLDEVDDRTINHSAHDLENVHLHTRLTEMWLVCLESVNAMLAALDRVQTHHLTRLMFGYLCHGDPGPMLLHKDMFLYCKEVRSPNPTSNAHPYPRPMDLHLLFLAVSVMDCAASRSARKSAFHIPTTTRYRHFGKLESKTAREEEEWTTYGRDTCGSNSGGSGHIGLSRLLSGQQRPCDS